MSTSGELMRKYSDIINEKAGKMEEVGEPAGSSATDANTDKSNSMNEPAADKNKTAPSNKPADQSKLPLQNEPYHGPRSLKIDGEKTGFEKNTKDQDAVKEGKSPELKKYTGSEPNETFKFYREYQDIVTEAELKKNS